MKILENIKNDNLKVIFNDHIHLPSVMKVILSHYSNLSDKDQLVPMTFPRMNLCSVIWIEKDNDVVGGICCIKEDQESTVNIESIFYRNFNDFKDLYPYCHKHLEIYAKKEGYNYVSVCFDINNDDYKEMIDNVGMIKRFYICSRDINGTVRTTT